ncbi:tRNA(1-methyladenosine) methyltransferase-like methyltransferase [Methanolobus tindarius DSM 2278]|uniref:tRNA(1-methyladenosine) methyltransferase-like methyltransferase n=1 Tax=Methanolobus tindarius DSM 2278 TaxID=1090322 RepID=W9DVZ5_METTI|nr:methyltransferase domain-containing protein [Methanolobus tindarius]ETA67571.1 tRNA(1-methyladenosine) methyltransferase-like methyltransferase [Methanolobus tindarius DSM 2278]
MLIGELVLLKTSHRDRVKEFIAKVSDDQLHTNFGIIELSSLVDKELGDIVVSHMGQEFTIQRPKMPDFFRHAKRTGAPMMPKDIGMIIAYTGLNKNDVVLDAGTGSGILTMYLGSIAKRVVTYEVNEEFMKVAAKNVQSADLDNVELRCGNIVDEIKNIDEKFDVITLDTQNTKDVIPNVKNVLYPGGFIATYSPFFEQTKEIRDALDAEGFDEVMTMEFTEREISFSSRGTRPSTSKVGHTGFITIARA